MEEVLDDGLKTVKAINVGFIRNGKEGVIKNLAGKIVHCLNCTRLCEW